MTARRTHPRVTSTTPQAASTTRLRAPATGIWPTSPNDMLQSAVEPGALLSVTRAHALVPATAHKVADASPTSRTGANVRRGSGIGA